MMFNISVIVAVAAIYIYFNSDHFNEDDIVGKNVLVTGASKGIGKALALKYARLGANVMITARNEHSLKEVVSECHKIGRAGAQFGYVVADMLEYEKTTEKVMKETLRIFKMLDQVIINHALLPGYIKASTWKSTREQLDFLEKSMDINFMSYVHLAGAVMPYLANSHGQLGVISSLAGKIPLYNSAPYSASKFALDGFFSTLRLEMQNMKASVSITLSLLGYIATEGFDEKVADRVRELNLDLKKVKANMPTVANVNDTAFEIIKATTRGDRELYYPRYMFGIHTWFVPILRHVFPSFVEINPKTLEL